VIISDYVMCRHLRVRVRLRRMISWYQNTVCGFRHDSNDVDDSDDSVYCPHDPSTDECRIDWREEYVETMSAFPCAHPTFLHVALYAQEITCRSIAAAQTSYTFPSSSFRFAMASSGEQQRPGKAPADVPAAAALTQAERTRAESKARAKAALMTAGVSKELFIQSLAQVAMDTAASQAGSGNGGGSVHDATGTAERVQVDETGLTSSQRAERAQRPREGSTAETLRRQELARAAGSSGRTRGQSSSEFIIEWPAGKRRRII
jgi:hypothetical protein